MRINMAQDYWDQRVLYTKDDDSIKFYTTKEFPYGCFSNFYRASIKLNGYVWPSSEHFYQAQKAWFLNTNEPQHRYEVLDAIREAASPKEAARIGRELDINRKVWDEEKLVYMHEAVKAKFTQHNNLKHVLLLTDNSQLVEFTEGTPLADSVWGNACDSEGRPGLNLLGKVLMVVRQEIRMEELAFDGSTLDI
jgi:ribA/ribD-fused uncharacterized protein